jgi:PAS domain S-box-containing protein
MTFPSPTLLLIDDFSPDRELYRRYLCISGNPIYRLLEAETAKNGLELCRTQQIDAILLDYLLPDATGIQFLTALQVQSNGNSPPVVMVTGEGDEMIAVQALKLGAEDYLVKRCLTPERLQSALRSALENARLRLQLRHQEERFRVSVENMLDCFGLFSAIRDEAGQIIDFQIDYLNKAACENNQMTAQEQLGKRLCELLPAHREGLFDEYCQVVEGGEPLLKESLVYADDYAGQQLIRAFDIHATQLGDGFVASWRDVTARKQAELERQQQLERERILNQITQQIRQSLNPDEVLNTAVREVRQFLNTDRALVYRFNPDFSGRIIVESVGEGWMPTLNTQIEDTCFIETQGEDFRRGRVSTVEDIATASLTDCHIRLLERFQVRANLVVPIHQGEDLWGLLVLHQCSRLRQWQPSEVELIQQLAAQVGIAIQQSELYQQVQQKQQFIQQISDAAPGFLYIYDLVEQRNIYSNRGIINFLGYTPEEIQAMGEAVLPQLFHPDDFAQVSVRIAQLQHSQPGENFESEFRLRHANGEWRWFGARETVYRRDAAGSVCQILGVAQEITDRKQLEINLTESERRFRELFNTSYQFVGLLTPEGIVLEANQTALDFAGLTLEAVMDRPFWEVRWWTLSAETQHQLQEAIARAAQGEFVRYEVEVLGVGDATITIDFSLKPVRDELGRVVLLIPEGRDISDRLRYEGVRQRLEAELRVSEAKLRQQFAELESIYATAPVGLCFQDANLRCVRINDRLAEINGIPAAAHVGRTIREVLPDLADTLEAIHHQVVNTGTPILGIEIQGTTQAQPGVERTWISSYYPLKDSTGQVLGVNVMVQDITELKQTQAALQESQAQFEAFMRYCPTTAYIKDEAGCYLYTNLLNERICNLSSDQWLGKTDFELFPPEVVQQWIHHDQIVLETNQPLEVIETYPLLDGEHTYLSYKFPIQLSPQRRLLGGLSLDITDRVQAEKRLQESEAQLQLGVQVAGIALARVDYASNTVTLSPEAAVRYGIADEMTSELVDELTVTRDRIHATFHPDEREEMERMIEQVLDPNGAGWFAREHRVVWPNGEVRWLDVRKQVFFDRTGNTPRPDHAILAAIDITDRKQAEQDRLLLARIVESSTDAIIGFTPERKIVSWNAGAERIFGYTSPEVLGQDIAILSPDDHKNDSAIVCARLQRGERIDPYETQRQRKDGSLVDVAVTISPIKTTEAEIIGVSMTARDITNQKRLEQERERLLAQAEAAREEAETANRSKDDFVSLVAHELRSPLNAIMGWAQLLQTRSFDAATTQRALETIIRNTRTQTQLIEDLLDVSRMVRGTLRMTMTSVDLSTVIEAAVETVQPAAEAKQLRLETQCSDAGLISGDFQRLQQVVINLLTNAIKFTPEGGQVQILLDQQNDQARIQVSDTGKGISPDFLPHIFERFRQDQQNATAKQGLGLGLAIVKYIVEQHQGIITVQSGGEGQGATFTVLLPLLKSDLVTPDEPALPLPSDDSSLSLEGVRVLLVDDDPNMLNLTTFVLEQFKAIVHTATSGAAALECFPQFCPDILISDIAMPELTGYELLRQIRLKPEGQIPAIAFTAYSSEAHREDSLQAGFAYHLVKPVEPEELVRVMLSLTQRRTVGCPSCSLIQTKPVLNTIPPITHSAARLSGCDC